MQLIVLDAETYWSATHSLTKMTPIEYVRHEDTELQTLAVRINGAPPFVLVGEQAMRDWAARTDFSDALVVGHNLSGFDSMICAWRLGIHPRLWGCTLSMARELGLARTVGGSLKALATHFGLHAKGDIEATNTKGRRLAEFTPKELHALVEYNKLDVDIGFELFRKLAKGFPARSMQLIDMTIRMLVEPRFRVDRSLIKITLREVVRARDEALLDIGRALMDDEMPLFEMSPEEVVEQTRAQLASAPKFAAVLKSLGVAVPMKASPSDPSKMIPALAKTDEAMTDLLDHDDVRVAAAAAARMQVKSVQLETRLQRFLDTAAVMGGTMPIALNYYGAENTGRWSGAFKLNAQNLPRVGKTPRPADALRKCLRAPEGHKVVVADLSGIELRMNHFLWRVPSSMELFRKDPAKADLYRTFAARLYYVREAEVTPEQRMLGKIGQLQLQYGSGAAKFMDVARLWGAAMEPSMANKVVQSWRELYVEIVRGWRRCGDALHSMARGDESLPLDPWGLCVTEHCAIRTPRGRITYPGLRREGGQWQYETRKGPMKIYGAKIVENLIQSLAREAMADMMLAVRKRYSIAHTVHDEIVLVVPEDDAEEALQFMQDRMRAGIEWFPELVTWSEGGIGDNYGDAKS